MIHRCSRCKNDAIIYQAYSGLHLCSEHFIQDLERKAKREIRRNHWLVHGDRIGLLLDGGRCSSSLLHLLKTITKGRRDITITGLYPGYDLPDEVQQIATIEDIEVLFFEDQNGEAARRPLPDRLAIIAQEIGVTAIALNTTLDDDAASILTAFVSGDISCILNTTSGLPKTIRWISPLATIPMEEVLLYVTLHNPGIMNNDEIIPRNDREAKIRSILSEYTLRHPSTLYAVAHIGEAIREAKRETKD